MGITKTRAVLGFISYLLVTGQNSPLKKGARGLYKPHQKVILHT